MLYLYLQLTLGFVFVCNMNDFSSGLFHLPLWFSKRGFHKMLWALKLNRSIFFSVIPSPQHSQYVSRAGVTDIKWCVLSIVILSVVITGSNVLNFVCVIFKIFTTTDSAWCYIVISCFIVAVSKVIPPSNVSNLLSRFRVYIWWNFEPVSFLFRCFDHFSELAWFLVCLYILSICGCTIFNCSVNIPTFLKFERSLSQANVSETSNILRGRRYMYSLTLQLFSLHSIHSTKRLCGTCCFTVS